MKDSIHRKLGKSSNKAVSVMFIVPLVLAAYGIWHYNLPSNTNIFEHEGVTVKEIQNALDKQLSSQMSKLQVEMWLKSQNIDFTSEKNKFVCSIFADPELVKSKRDKNSLRPVIAKLKEIARIGPKILMPKMRAYAPTFILNLSFDKNTGKYSGACIRKPIGGLHYSYCP